VIEERADRIKRDLDAADRLQGETEKALQAYEKALADARANASAIARQTRDKLAAETDAERSNVEATLASKLANAEKAIAATKAKALVSISEIAADTAGAVVRSLTGKDVSPEDVKRALQSASDK
jgi:F-type H+-transporting ATPase subunit b